MSRWHESGCRRPEVSVIDTIPCCQYCFALASLDNVIQGPSLSILSIPERGRGDVLNLTWPSSVEYTTTTASAQVIGSSSVSRPRGSAHASHLPDIAFDDEIRIVRLMHGQGDEPIHINMQGARLRTGSSTKYDALSYTWLDEDGNMGKPSPIYVGSFWDIVYVTSNCESALRSLRSSDVDRLLWVDCLCIDYNNPEEKSRQTQLMREIYMNSSRVVAYLGETSAESELALDIIRAATGTFDKFNEASQNTLHALFARRYFSRLWSFSELLLAGHLEFFCGQSSATWSDRLSIDKQILPSLLMERSSSSGIGGYNLLDLLLLTSQYDCSDPRDKVFAILALLYEKDLNADYTLPVEVVYIGIAAYLVHFCRNLDIFALAGISKSKLDMPSWVPDWSQRQTKMFPEEILWPEPKLKDDESDKLVMMSSPLAFAGFEDTEYKVSVDATIGSLQISAMKLCDIQGDCVLIKDYIHIVPSTGDCDKLIVTVFDTNYRIGMDSVFLLNGWNHPVILRYQPERACYVLVSVCALSIKPYLLSELVPRDNGQSRLRVSNFTREERDRIGAFERQLLGLCMGKSLDIETEPSNSHSSVTNRVLDFARLSQTYISDTEAQLRNTWNALENKLGWMFLDRNAVLAIVSFLNETNPTSQIGEADMPLKEGEWEALQFKAYCRLDFPSKYSWDLSRFCLSYLRDPFTTYAYSENMTPLFYELRERLQEIQEWAQVTEQLLQLFRYTGSVLKHTFPFFLGSQLPERWTNLSGNVDNTTWDWSYFKTALRMREQLWSQRLPEIIDPSTNITMAARMTMHALGVELENQVVVTIQ